MLQGPWHSRFTFLINGFWMHVFSAIFGCIRNYPKSQWLQRRRSVLSLTQFLRERSWGIVLGQGLSELHLRCWLRTQSCEGWPAWRFLFLVGSCVWIANRCWLLAEGPHSFLAVLLPGATVVSTRHDHWLPPEQMGWECKEDPTRSLGPSLCHIDLSCSMLEGAIKIMNARCEKQWHSLESRLSITLFFLKPVWLCNGWFCLLRKCDLNLLKLDWGFLGGSVSKESACAVGATGDPWVWSLGREGPLEEGLATHSSILAWRIPWTEEPGGLQSMGSQSWTRLKWLSTYACRHRFD